MSKPQVRLWGDPFRGTEASQALRRFLSQASAQGWCCSLSLTGAVGEAPGVGRALGLTDGVRALPVRTRLADAELAPIRRAAAQAVAATAPLAVFGDEDQITTAGLEYPEACLVWSGLATDPGSLLAGLGEALPSVGTEITEPSLEGSGYLLGLEPPDPDAPLLHPSTDVFADGTDVLLRVYSRLGSERRGLTVVLPRRDAAFEAKLLGLVQGDAAAVSFAEGPLAEHLRHASAIVWPVRALREPSRLLELMVSGRPLVTSRNRQTASILSAPGLVMAVGGRHVSTWCEPDPRLIEDGVRRIFAGWDRSLAMAVRARSHVLTHHVAPRPARPRPVARHSRPRVVLEAPLFETSSSSTLTIETALALQRRDRVDLQLVPRLPFRTGVEEMRLMAPSLVPLLSRNPGPVDLWLSAGWPPRADRPDTGCFALRLDWEYGSLPAELSPLVPEEADLIVVHSSAVRRAVQASGRDAGSIATIPHGVDGAVFHERAESSAEVLRFKRGRPAVLFVGGLIWRKGIDLFLKAVAEVGRQVEICAVVKPLGGASSYFGSSLDGLVRKFSQTPGAPEVLILDRELSRQELAGVYRACDLLVHPYRGEGFGMPVLEARATGLPVMVSSGGSTDEFCDDPAAVRIPTRAHHPRLETVCISRPQVLEPDSTALVSEMTRALAGMPELRDAAVAAAGTVRARFTWERAAEGLERIAFRIARPCADKRSEHPQSRRPPVPTMS